MPSKSSHTGHSSHAGGARKGARRFSSRDQGTLQAKAPATPKSRSGPPGLEMAGSGKAGAGREGQGFLLAAPPVAAFPHDLILPPHRGAIISTAAWPAGLVPAPQVAARQGMAARSLQAPKVSLPPRPERAPNPPPDGARQHVGRGSDVVVPATPVCSEERPVVEAPFLVDMALLAPDDRAPLPRNRAPAPVRQGLLGAVAASLGDAGRFLAGLIPGSRRARDLRDRVARTEARLRAMEAQLAALEAVRARVRA